MQTSQTVIPSASLESVSKTVFETVRRRLWLDLALAALIMVGGAFWYTHLRAPLPDRLFTNATQDAWFNADLGPLTSELLTIREGDKGRSTLHPMFPLVAGPIMHAMVLGAHISPALALYWFIGGVFSLWPALLYACLRRVGLPMPDAAVFACLGLASAGATFFLAVPLYYGLGSITLMLAFWLVMAARHSSVPDRYMIAASALSISMTVTSWMFGWIATLLRYPFRRAIQTAVNGFAAMTFLWIIGHLYVPGSRFIGPTLFEKQFIYLPTVHRVLGVLASFGGYSIVAPKAGPFVNVAGTPGRTFQDVLPALDASLLLLVAWLVLLGVGAWSLYRSGDRFLARLLGCWLGAQLLLHIVYGEETFLYSLHWIPSLILVASCACRRRMRVPILIAAACLALATGISNERRVQEVVAELVAQGTL